PSAEQELAAVVVVGLEQAGAVDAGVIAEAGGARIVRGGLDEDAHHLEAVQAGAVDLFHPRDGGRQVGAQVVDAGPDADVRPGAARRRGRWGRRRGGGAGCRGGGAGHRRRGGAAAAPPAAGGRAGAVPDAARGGPAGPDRGVVVADGVAGPAGPGQRLVAIGAL